MKKVSRLFCLVFIGALSLQVSAQETVSQTTRSVGRLVSDDSVLLSRDIKQQEPVESVLKSEGPSLDQSLFAARYDQFFSIYSASVDLVSDLDGDGFHHAFNVGFDVDVNFDAATLYAKLYLSREGGPWTQYYTTELFNIYYDDASDAYEVMTELLEGYPTGYYAVLVEIYSLNHVGVVASTVLDHHNLGWDIRLEDLGRDEDYVHQEVQVSVSHGAGSFSLFIWLLLVQVVIAARGIFTLSPLNIIRRRKNTPELRSFSPALQDRPGKLR